MITVTGDVHRLGSPSPKLQPQRIIAAEENDEEAARPLSGPGTSTPNPANLYERMSCPSLHIQIRFDPIPKNYFTHPAGRA